MIGGIIFLVLLGFSNADNLSAKEFKLELVQTLFRHGERTPIECEASLIPNNNESNYAPWGYSQLTTDGMIEEYKIGKMLRKRYREYLPDLYRPEDVYAYSSDYARTKTSLQLVLAALYPPVGNLIWNDQLNWLPIPIHYSPRSLDILMKPRNCPRYVELSQELHNSQEIKSAMAKHNDVFQVLKNAYGKRFKFHKIICAFNLVLIHKNLNLTMPTWYTDQVFDKITEATKFYLDTLSYTPELTRLNGGTIVKRFVENMNTDHPKTTSKKIFLYSSHDKTLHSFLKAHGLADRDIPDYGSAIILEKLRDQQRKVFIKILMWTGEPKKLITLKLKGCTEICPLEEYLKIINPVLPTDDEMRCLFKNLQSTDIERILNTYSITSGAA